MRTPLKFSSVFVLVIILLMVHVGGWHTAVQAAPQEENLLIHNLYFVVRTSTIDGADTDSNILLEIKKSNGKWSSYTPAQDWDENEPGRTEIYAFDVRDQDLHVNAVSGPRNVCIKVDGDDAWLPSLIIFAARTEDGNWTFLYMTGWDDSWWISGAPESDVTTYPGRNLLGESC